MRPIKKLNDTIQYADLYRKLKSYAEERRGFNYGGLATGELNMEDDPDNSYSFSEQFYSNRAAIEQQLSAKDLLDSTLADTRAKIKARIYKDNANALNMDSLGEIFAVFNDPNNQTMTDAPTVSLSDVEGATQFVNESGETTNYEVDGMDTNIPKAMIAMRKEGMGKYDTLFNNQNNIKRSKYYGKDVTQMTLGQVAEFSKKGGEYNKHNNKQYGANTTATGYYQMLGSTIEDILKRGGKELGLNKQSMYNKENQDKMYIWYMSDTISRKKTLEGMRQSVMARWEAFRNNKLTEKRKDSKGETFNYYFPKDRGELEGVIFEHLRAFHPDHPILKSLGTKRSN
mgnify:CR=1 FL=1